MVYGLLFPAVVAYSGPLRTFQAVAVNSAASTAYAMVTLPAYSARRPARDESGYAPASGPCQPPLELVYDGSGTVTGYQSLGPFVQDVWAIRNVDFARFEPPAGGWMRAMAEAYAGALCSRVFAVSGCILGGQGPPSNQAPPSPSIYV
ncbi:hypothetical protein BC628DRAFT_1342338 [Trametes gibbosa]|nr:hypothetical protein BC628DRAFT_1342338 [Trametes gibbosa]